LKAEFDSFSENYEQILDRSIRISGEGGEYFAGLKARYVSAVVGGTFSGSILDFGCGVGLLAGLLQKQVPSAQLHGYDVSRDSIERVRSANACRGVFTWQKTELRRNYDVIVISNVMHHIAPADRRGTIVELEARLAPGGKLVLFEHNPANPLTRWVVGHCPFDKNAHLLWPREARACFAAAGLKILRKDYVVFLPRPLARFRPVESLLGWCPLGAQYVLVGARDERGK
jgi:2-polyprenyl-3-methyl-5-hydroxy-6-metoxy-1,4-benzoquinol methylase